MALRQYGTGIDGTVPGFGGCPFNFKELQKDYEEGNITPTRIIRFGGSLKTDAELTKLVEGDKATTKREKNELDVLAIAGWAESSTLNYRIANLHKPGGIRHSGVWVAIPQNKVVPQLVQRLLTGSVPSIAIMTTNFIAAPANGENNATIVLTHEFSTCFIRQVDYLGHAYIAAVEFTFVKVKITQNDVKMQGESGAEGNQVGGSYVYEIDFSAANGKSAG
jgi:hypothetical protein